MILLVDIGNSNLKWIFYNKKNGFGRVVVVPLSKSTFQVDIQKSWSSLEKPDQLIISNVAGPLIKESLREWTSKVWNLEPYYVTSERFAFGVTNAYTNPTQLGVDRWVNLIAVYTLGLGDVCLFSCGSAMTLDLLTFEGQHKGGAIIPGITTMRQQLVHKAHALQPVSKGQNPGASLFASDTEQGIIGGTLHAASAFIEHGLATAITLLNRPVKIVITGGDSPTILPYLKSEYIHEPNLIFKGLVGFSKA